MSAVDVALATAQLQLGEQYVFGDEGPDSFDCSGLTQYSYGAAGIALPRTAAQQQAWATPVTTPAPGDLVFWGRPAHHVALYLGNGKIISAPHAGAVVSISSVGHPTSYGRVPGSGAALAAPINVAAGIGGWLGSTVTGWLGGARHIVLEASFAALGLVLLGYGAYRIVIAPTRRALTGG